MSIRDSVKHAEQVKYLIPDIYIDLRESINYFAR